MTFKDLTYRIANPGVIELFVFSVLMTPIICFGIWSCSFSWIPPLELILIGLLGAGVIAALVATYLDQHLAARLYKYAWTLVALLVSYWVLWYPIRNILLAESMKRGELISNRISQFLEENGRCPISLEESYFDDVHKWSSIGSRFSCSMEGECSVSFAGFGGCWWAYSAKSKEWYVYD